MPPKKTAGDKPAKSKAMTSPSTEQPTITDQSSSPTSRPTAAIIPRNIPTTNPELTEYIRTLRGAERSALSRISQLPVLREMHLRENNTFKLQTPKGDRPSYLSSAAGQIRGTEHVGGRACTRCIKGVGQYKECVTVDGEFKGACCNCSFDSGLNKCTFYVAPTTSKAKSEKDADNDAEENPEHESGDPPDDCEPVIKKFEDHDPGSGTGGAQGVLAS